jgi:hypothetical protein
MYSPAGTTTISGHSVQSGLKASDVPDDRAEFVGGCEQAARTKSTATETKQRFSFLTLDNLSCRTSEERSFFLSAVLL